MQKFTPQRLEAEARRFIRDWVNLLSEGRYEEAVQLLDLPLGATEVHWNAGLLKDLINDYAGLSVALPVNDPHLMDEDGEKIYFYFYNDASGFAVDYDVPVSGEWSDLTARFSFKKKGDQFCVYLEDVHVL